MRHQPGMGSWSGALTSRLLGQVFWGQVLFDFIMQKLFENVKQVLCSYRFFSAGVQVVLKAWKILMQSAGHMVRNKLHWDANVAVGL